MKYIIFFIKMSFHRTYACVICYPYIMDFTMFKGIIDIYQIEFEEIPQSFSSIAIMGKKDIFIKDIAKVFNYNKERKIAEAKELSCIAFSSAKLNKCKFNINPTNNNMFKSRIRVRFSVYDSPKHIDTIIDDYYLSVCNYETIRSNFIKHTRLIIVNKQNLVIYSVKELAKLKITINHNDIINYDEQYLKYIQILNNKIYYYPIVHFSYYIKNKNISGINFDNTDISYIIV